MSENKRYEMLIDEMPAGLDRALLRIISMHQGLDQAIGKPALLADLGRMGFGVNERQVRRTIQELRKAGHLICSSSGEGGYYLAASLDEYATFAEAEYRSKIVDMSKTLAAMDQAAQKEFGASQGIQKSMF